MTCSTCGGDVVTFDVPADLESFSPEQSRRAGICQRCLSVDPMPVSATGGGGGRAADFDTISEAFPPDDSGGVPFALLLGLLSSLAINRDGIEQLLARVERSGSDPLLAIDRLVADSSIDPAVDLERRRHQLETFL